MKAALYALEIVMGKQRRRGRGKISAQFAPRLIEMLESPAYRALSLSARRVLDRLEIELGHHGGNDNGKLPVTYQNFVDYGIDRTCIFSAIQECSALGFTVVTEWGVAGIGEFRTPTLYRLTYRPADGIDGDGSHEWRMFTSLDEALSAAKTARTIKSTRNYRPSKQGSKKHFSVGKNPLKRVGKTHSNEGGSVGKTHSNPEWEKPTTIYISGCADE